MTFDICLVEGIVGEDRRNGKTGSDTDTVLNLSVCDELKTHKYN